MLRSVSGFFVRQLNQPEALLQNLSYWTLFQLSVGGPAALLSQLVTTVSVTHWGRIEHHDYCSKQALSSSVYSLIRTVQRDVDSIGKHCRTAPQLVLFSTCKVSNSLNKSHQSFLRLFTVFHLKYLQIVIFLRLTTFFSFYSICCSRD